MAAPPVESRPSTADANVFTIKAATLKFETRDDILPYLRPLIDNPDVEEVHLSGNTYGVEACKFLAEILATKKNLKVAQFADIFSTRLRTEIPQSLDYILSAILNHPKLHTINLSDNAFGLTVQEPLIKFFSSHLPLEHLILTNNGMGHEAGSNLAKALATLAEAKLSSVATTIHDASSPNGAPTSSPPLKTFICGRNRLGDGAMTAWAKCFQANRHLTTIRMPQNGIRPDGITDILRNGVIHDHDLQVLDLQDNTFTLNGALALTDILPELPNLVDLGVGDCLLSARGGIIVAETLKKASNTKLEHIRLAYNEIDLRGAKQLLTAVKLGIPALKRLELNGNKFAEDDDVVEEFRSLFMERGFGELDELDEMEEMSEDEQEAEENEEESGDEGIGHAHGARDILRKETAAEEEQNVAPEKDKETDELADMLKKTSI
jgi:Ran GTPase-activating protein 1